jgi:hypothetical protein
MRRWAKVLMRGTLPLFFSNSVARSFNFHSSSGMHSWSETAIRTGNRCAQLHTINVAPQHQIRQTSPASAEANNSTKVSQRCSAYASGARHERVFVKSFPGQVATALTSLGEALLKRGIERSVVVALQLKQPFFDLIFAILVEVRVPSKKLTNTATERQRRRVVRDV